MGRKRIIIDTEDDIDYEEKSKKILDKLNEIQKKLTAPWVMPAILVVLTAAMTFINYRVQRHYANEDLFKNKTKEKFAEMRATAVINFSKRAIEILDTIDINFNAYCNFEKDTSGYEEKTINNSLIELNALITHQLFIDSAVKKKIIDYTGFMNSKGPGLAQEADNPNETYKKSKAFYGNAVNGIISNLEQITR